MTTYQGTHPIEDVASELSHRLRGEVLTPAHARYDDVRRVWNGAIDRRPALIVRCETASDVVEAVRAATANDLRIAVRGGGHSIPGLSVCDGGMMIDLQPMKAITVDAEAHVAHVEPGVVWGELDRATQEHGLAVTGGEVSDTGVAGLTLGGGIGWLKRTIGLSCDNLLAAEVVTADGRIVEASATSNTELFWALRGGGGNFGIVTRFTFRLHRVGPILFGGAVVHPGDRAGDVLRFLRDQSAVAPDEVSLMVALVTAPPAPEFPEELHGRPIAVLGAAYIGDVAAGEEALRHVREFGPPAADLLGPIPYVALQQLVDPMTPKGLGYYVKSEWLAGLSDPVIDGLVRQHQSSSSPLDQILVHQLGGAMRRVPEGGTAFTYRDAPFMLTAAAGWPNPTDPAEAHRAWARATWELAQVDSAGGGYVNHLDGDEPAARVREAYDRATLARLVAVKQAWDPRNVFRLNQNIDPTARP